MFVHFSRGALAGASDDVASCVEIVSDFAFTFHTFFVGEDDLEEEASWGTWFSSGSTSSGSSTMFFSSGYRSSYLDTSPL